MELGSEDVGLRRKLGAIDATCVVIGAIIGVGIFFTPTRVASLAGNAELALLAWAIGGAIALFGALTFAELGSMYSRSGAQYSALCDAYGPFVAFLYVFCNATAIQAGAIAIIATICAQNLGIAITGHSLPLSAILGISIVLILALCAANWLGVQWGSRVQNITVFAKIITLLAITTLALIAGEAPKELAGVAITDASPWRTTQLLYAALVPCLFSFGGWQHALWIGGEVRNPSRNVPLAIVAGVAVVVLVYLLVNWAYFDLLGHAGVHGSAALASDAVAVVLPGTGQRIVALAVALSAFGVLNAQLLSGPRLVYAMAREGRFFSVFRKLDARHATPFPAIFLLSALAVVLLLAAYVATDNPIGAVDQLLTGVVFIDGFFFALTGMALFVLRRHKPTASRPIRVPLFPILPALFVIGEIGVVLGAYADEGVRASAFIGLAWIGVASLLYLSQFRRPSGEASTPRKRSNEFSNE